MTNQTTPTAGKTPGLGKRKPFYAEFRTNKGNTVLNLNGEVLLLHPSGKPFSDEEKKKCKFDPKTAWELILKENKPFRKLKLKEVADWLGKLTNHKDGKKIIKPAIQMEQLLKIIPVKEEQKTKKKFSGNMKVSSNNGIKILPGELEKINTEKFLREMGVSNATREERKKYIYPIPCGNKKIGLYPMSELTKFPKTA